MIFRNTLAQSATRITAYLFGFILAPIMISRLGLAQFGVWAATGGVALYAGLMDLGITRAVARFVALHSARGDRGKVEETLGLGLAIVAVVGVTSLTAAYFGAPAFVSVLGELDTPTMRVVLMSSASIMTFQALKTVLAAVPVGLQNMGPPNAALTAGNVVNFGASLAALAVSTDLAVYAVANAAAELVNVGIVLAMLVMVWSPTRARRPSRSLTKETLAFSLKSQVSWVADLINLQTDKIIVAAVVDVRAAGAYEVAARVVVALKTVAALTISALVPAATTMIAQQGRGVMAWFYRHYTSRTSTLAFAVFGFACVSAPFLLLGWIGDVPPQSTALLVVLTTANAFNIVTGVSSSLSLAEGGGVRLMVRASVASAVTNVALTVALAPVFGLWGIVAASVVAIAGSAVLFQVEFHRMYEIPLRVLGEAIGPPALVVVAAALPFAAWYAVAGADADSRLGGVVGTALVAATFLPVVLVVSDRLGLLPRQLSIRARLVRS